MFDMFDRPPESECGYNRTPRRMPASGKAQDCRTSATCRRMPYIAVDAQARYNLNPPASDSHKQGQESAMGEASTGTPPSVKPAEDRLDSWKEIAAYFNRDVTTVQRWEKREGMPVHRHLHDRMGSVYASRSELSVWSRGRNLQAGLVNGFEAPALDPA